MEARHRRWTALPDGRATGERGGHRRRCAEPYAGPRTPRVRPHRMTRNTGRAQCTHTADPCNKVEMSAKPTEFLHEKTRRIGRLCGKPEHHGFPTGLCCNLEHNAGQSVVPAIEALIGEQLRRVCKRVQVWVTAPRL